MMSRAALAAAFAAALAGVTLLIPTAASAKRSPLPPWLGAGQHVYLLAGKTPAAQLMVNLSGWAPPSGAQIIVVLVDVADREGTGSADAYGNPAMDFGDDLYDAWVKGGALQAGLDGRKHVIITHALSNRAVGIHWGAD